MYWADQIAKEIIDSKKYKSSLPLRGKPYWVDDMKTPSGFAHIGSLRGPIIHSLLFRALKDARVKVKFTFVINDFDSADEMPPEFKDELSDYLGFPLRKVPSPKKGFDSLGSFMADDFKKVLRDLGVEAGFLSSWDMYHEGKFDGVIKEALDSSSKIQDIYQKISGSKKREKGWLPFQVICPKCGRLGTNRVYAWDGKEVSYKCEPSLVSWAKGCGHEGKISPYGGTGKLPWKVDWAAHWKVIGITIEGAGKDHASAGGSYDISMALCEEVFDYPHPYKLPYEFFLIGGKKMSSSKGLGLKAHDATKILPAEIVRFLFTRTDYSQAIEFNPMGTMAIPDLFDEYDRCWGAYVTGSDENLARAFELSQIKNKPSKEKIYLPRFRDVANFIQLPNINLKKKFEEEKGKILSAYEFGILKEREEYAKVWIEKYSPSEYKVQMIEEISEGLKFSKDEKEYLKGVRDLIVKEDNPEKLQLALYNLAKKLNVPTKDAFAAVYQIFIGKKYGPKAAWFLLSYPKEKVIERLEEVSK